MRQLVLHALEGRLPDELGDARPGALVGDRVGRVERLGLGHEGDELPFEDVELGRGKRGDRDDGIPVAQVAHRLQLRRHSGPGGRVDLRDDRDLLRPREGVELLVDVAVAGAELLVRRHAQPDDVDLGEGVLHDRVEPLAEQGARAVHPRGVDDDELPVRAVHDPADGAPGRLRLR